MRLIWSPSSSPPLALRSAEHSRFGTRYHPPLYEAAFGGCRDTFTLVPFILRDMANDFEIDATELLETYGAQSYRGGEAFLILQHLD